jgi:aldehyde dehydrogenase (NAD+)
MTSTSSDRLKRAYGSVHVGDPLDSATLVGPLIDGQVFEVMQRVLA